MGPDAEPSGDQPDSLGFAGAVDGEADRDIGRSSSIARTTPSVITSVRANAPQKLMSRLRTRGLARTSRSAGTAFV